MAGPGDAEKLLLQARAKPRTWEFYRKRNDLTSHFVSEKQFGACAHERVKQSSVKDFGLSKPKPIVTGADNFVDSFLRQIIPMVCSTVCPKSLSQKASRVFFCWLQTSAILPQISTQTDEFRRRHNLSTVAKKTRKK